MNEYLKKLNIQFEEINTLSIENIKNISRKVDTRKWKEDMKVKSSLKIYREFKLEIKEEKFYDNRDSSKYFFQAKTNTLPLNTTRRHIGGETKCELCNYENEDLIHFLLDCKGLEHKRNVEIMRKNLKQSKEATAGSILFGKEDKEDIKDMIDKMWNYRIGKKFENEKNKEIQNKNKTKSKKHQKKETA